MFCAMSFIRLKPSSETAPAKDGVSHAVVLTPTDDNEASSSEESEDEDSDAELVEDEPPQTAAEKEEAERREKEKKEEDARAARLKKEHLFIDTAKIYDWPELAKILWWDHIMVNVSPAGRWTVLHKLHGLAKSAWWNGCWPRRRTRNSRTRTVVQPWTWPRQRAS